MPPFKVGSFNILVSFTVVTVCVTGIGVLPYYLNRLLNGEYPTIRDDFEKWMIDRKAWHDGSLYAATKTYKADQTREQLEASWRQQHASMK